MVLGSAKELKEHADMMRKMPEMEHADANQITVDPEKAGELIWQITKQMPAILISPVYNRAILKPARKARLRLNKYVYIKQGNDMKTVAVLFAAVLVLVAPLSIMAADQMPGMDHATMQGMNTSEPTGAMTSGEVKKIDKDAGKITIKHGPLTNLDMPAMTMVFRVKDPTMVDQINVGDKISFVAEKVNGALTVTKLQPAN
jgi:Cu(I)/Ag(I) efflux system periplasmic protein CusF